MSNSDSDSDSSFGLEENPNHVRKNDKLRDISIVSFNYSNFQSSDDIVISVKHMFAVAKNIRDKYDGTAKELQTALLDIDANKESYDFILEGLKSQVSEFVSDDFDDEYEMTVYVGCDDGKQRSVAVACMLDRDLRTYVKQLNLGDIKVTFNLEHRDLKASTVRKNKKFIDQNRSKNRDKKYK